MAILLGAGKLLLHTAAKLRPQQLGNPRQKMVNLSQRSPRIVYLPYDYTYGFKAGIAVALHYQRLDW